MGAGESQRMTESPVEGWVHSFRSEASRQGMVLVQETMLEGVPRPGW